MNYDIFIPVRLSNTRLPGKALKPIHGKPVLHYLIERLKQIPKISNIVICTTTNSVDDPLIEFCKNEKISFYRGSEKDILNRFLEASQKFNSDFIINVDGDDIYTDPDLINELISEYEKNKPDYIDMIGFPFGFRSVAFTRDALKKICSLKDTINTETGYRDFFKKNSQIICYDMIFHETKSVSKNLRFSLDYNEDLELAEIVIKKLGNNFHLDNLIELFTLEPELLKITENLDEKWKKHYDENLADFSFKDKVGN